MKTVHVGDTVKYRPEYQDCQAIAQKSGIPVQEVIEQVMQSVRRSAPPVLTHAEYTHTPKALSRRDHG